MLNSGTSPSEAMIVFALILFEAIRRRCLQARFAEDLARMSFTLTGWEAVLLQVSSPKDAVPSCGGA